MNESSDTVFVSKTSQSQQLNNTILSVIDCSYNELQSLLNKFHLNFHLVENHQSIPGSFWGDSEAGLIHNKLYVRKDTPIHSFLHETCHYICMNQTRRHNLHTNAGNSYDEENAVCYLQILLAEDISGMNRDRMMQEMDSWGYTFRLGSTRAWFENDAEDALNWLQNKKLLDDSNRPNYTLRIE